MKYQFWSFILRLALFSTGIFLYKSSVFGYGEGVFLGERILSAAIGVSLLFVSVIISLPKIMNHPERMEKLEKFSSYLIQASIWSLLSLLIIELTLRVTIYNPPLHMDSSNWAGDIPGVNSMILWGQEGYAITQYKKWREIRTPYHDSKKDNDIIILGDSQTEGLQVADGYKFPSFAETGLRQDGYDLDLHNLGRSGLAMADYISWIPVYQILYQPKVIVIQITDSDFVDSFHLDQFNYFVAQDNRIIDLVHTFDFSSGFTQRARMRYNWGDLQMQVLGNERWKTIQQTTENSIGENAESKVSTVELNTQLETFNSELATQQMEMLISASDNVPLVVVLLPYAPYISGDEIHLSDPAHEQLKEFIKSFSEVTIIDPLPEFQQLASAGQLPRGFLNTNPGVGHLNKYGHEIIGQLLAEAIEQVLK